MRRSLVLVTVLLLGLWIYGYALGEATISDLEEMISCGYMIAPAGIDLYEDQGLSRHAGRLTADAVVYAQPGTYSTHVAFAVRGQPVSYWADSQRLRAPAVTLRPAGDAVKDGIVLQNALWLPDTPEDEGCREIPIPEEPQTDDDDPVSTLPKATATDLQTKVADVFFTLADQTDPGQITLKWQPIAGAKGYIITYDQAGRQRSTRRTVTNAKITGLDVCAHVFTVQAYEDRYYRNPLGDAFSVTITLDDWHWAAAPVALTALQPDPEEAVVQITVTAGAADYDGLQLSDNKRTILGQLQSEETLLLTLPTGIHTLWARPYRILSDGSLVYGSYTRRGTRITISIGWRKLVPKVKAKQLGSDQVLLTWDTIPGAQYYTVYNQYGSRLDELDTTEDNEILLQGLQGKTYRFVVVPMRDNALGDTECGRSSAQTVLRVDPYWWKKLSTTLSAEQISSRRVSLSWTAIPGVQEYEIYEYIRNKPQLIDTVYDDELTYIVTGVEPGRHTYAIRPCADGVSGSYFRKTITTGRQLTHTLQTAWKQNSPRGVSLSLSANGSVYLWQIYVQQQGGWELFTEEDGTFQDGMTRNTLSLSNLDLRPGVLYKLGIRMVEEQETEEDPDEAVTPVMDAVISVRLASSSWRDIYDIRLVQQDDVALLRFTCHGEADAYRLSRMVNGTYVNTLYDAGELDWEDENTCTLSIDDITPGERLTCFITPCRYNDNGGAMQGNKSRICTLTVTVWDGWEPE